jgi:hypothetical protein
VSGEVLKRQYVGCPRENATPGTSVAWTKEALAALSESQPNGVAVVRSAARLESRFEVASALIRAEVSTDPGQVSTSIRGIEGISGRIYFRVPAGWPLEMQLDSRITWSPGAISNRAGVAVRNLTNSLAVGHVLSPFDPSGMSESSRKKTLPPGADYELTWHVQDEPFPARAGKVTLAINIVFTPSCSPIFRNPDEAARAALKDAWALTARDRARGGRHVEYGGLLYKVSNFDYRFVPPVRGKATDEGGAVQGRQMVEEFTTLPPECRTEGAEFAGIYHTHPPEVDPTFLSMSDLNFAINTKAVVYMQGNNAQVCGIHRYVPAPGHEVDNRNFGYLEEYFDSRRKVARWIPLEAGRIPMPCDPEGKPISAR